MENKTILYDSPLVEIIEVESEKGFASSQFESVNPDGGSY